MNEESERSALWGGAELRMAAAVVEAIHRLAAFDVSVTRCLECSALFVRKGSLPDDVLPHVCRRARKIR